jgi:hypothetical protein
MRNLTCGHEEEQPYRREGSTARHWLNRFSEPLLRNVEEGRNTVKLCQDTKRWRRSYVFGA